MDAQKIAEIYNMPIELVVSSLRNLTQRLDKDGFVKISKEPEQVEKPAQVIQPEIEYIGTGVADATIIPALRRDQARKPSPEVLKAMEWLRLIAAELPTSPEGESEIEEIPHGLFAGEAQMPEPERFERVNESSFEDIANAFIPVLGDIDMHQRKRRIPPMSDAPETVGMSGLLRLFIVEGETAEQISRYYKQKYKINLAPESIEPYMNYIFSELRQTEDRSRLDDSLVRQARKNRNPFAVFNRTHRLVKTIKDSYKGSTVTEDQIWDNLPQFLREVFNELRSSGIDPYSLAAFEDVTAHF
jgi:hypothetical protein